MGMWISSASAHAIDLNIKVAPQSACYFGDWDLILSDLAADHKANVESSLVMTVEQGDQVSSFRLLGSKDSEAPVNLEFPVSLKSATAPIRISLCKDSSSLQSCKGKRSESFEQMASRYIYTEPQLLLPKSEFEALREARRKLPSPEDRIYFFNVITSSPQERSTSEIGSSSWKYQSGTRGLCCSNQTTVSRQDEMWIGVRTGFVSKLRIPVAHGATA